MNGWRLGSSEYPREPHFETHGLLAGRHLFRGGCNLYDCCKTPVQLGCRALRIRKASCMDNFIAALPHTFFVCGTAGCSWVKPIAAYLLGTGHVATGIFVLVVGEI